MSLRLFADHCVSNAIIRALQDTEHEVFRLRDHIQHDAPDALVIAKAHDLNSILISLNGDFADIVTYPPANHGGIIALQVRNHPEVMPAIIQRLTAYLSAYPNAEHYKGKLLIVEPHRIRIRE